jgi:cytochrome P450
LHRRTVRTSCWHRIEAVTDEHNRVAWRELRLILSTILRRYEISMVDGQNDEIRVRGTPFFAQGFYNVGFKLRNF